MIRKESKEKLKILEFFTPVSKLKPFGWNFAKYTRYNLCFTFITKLGRMVVESNISQYAKLVLMSIA